MDLSALISKALVAYTVEVDNEFEREMMGAGYPGAFLSLYIWTNLMRLMDKPATVRQLRTRAPCTETQTKHHLGCLERWRFISLASQVRSDDKLRREGWGSGRGILQDWKVYLTPRGRAAFRIWPVAVNTIEQRWKKRFGDEQIHGLRAALLKTLEPAVADLPLHALLSQALLKFEVEFDRDSPLPLVYAANTLRVLGDNPIRLSEIPYLTGTSPETSDIGWRIKPYVIVTSDPFAKRGKMVHLSPKGLKAQRIYLKLVNEISRRWAERFGQDVIDSLRYALEELFRSPLIVDGLIPAAGTVRSGQQVPALGRKDVGTAARQRMRDLVAQTEAFINNPAANLPHFPAWDMNRGFGP